MADKKDKPDKLGKWQKIIYIFAAFCGIIYGASTQVWSMILKPAVQKVAQQEQVPVVRRLENVEELLVYQNIVHTVRADSSEKAEIDLLFKIWKRGKGKLSNHNHP